MRYNALNIHKYAFRNNLRAEKMYLKLQISIYDSMQCVTNAYVTAKYIIPSFKLLIECAVSMLPIVPDLAFICIYMYMQCFVCFLDNLI